MVKETEEIEGPGDVDENPAGRSSPGGQDPLEGGGGGAGDWEKRIGSGGKEWMP